MAFSVAAVSSSVSPLFTEEVETDMLITSAPESLAGQLEAGARARRVLEEQVDQRAPAQQVALRLARTVEQHVALGQVEQMADLGRMQALDRQQVLLPVRHDPRSQKPARAVNLSGVAGEQWSLCGGGRSAGGGRHACWPAP